MSGLAPFIRWLCALLLAATAASVSAQSSESRFGHYRPAPAFPDIVSESLYLPMRDGVRLAVRIDRPANGALAAEGRFPVIWHHSLSISGTDRDGTGGATTAIRSMPNLARHGYVVVQVARRGNGQSFGVRRGYNDRNEAQDAYDVTQWLAAQSWSNSMVGIYGCSNTGDAAMHALTMRPPALRAAFAGCFSWHKYDAFLRGGIFAQWGTGPTRTVADDMQLPPVQGDADKVLLRQAAEEHQLATPLMDLWRQMPHRDSHAPLVGSRFWAESSAASYLDQIRRSGVALYILGGWRDELRDQGLIAHLNIPGSRIVIGPWKHCENDDFPLLEEIHRFFDQHLKGADTGLLREPPIHYYVTNAAGEGAWRTSDRWPLPAAVPQQLHFGRGVLSPASRPAPTASFQVRDDISCPDAGTGSRVQPCHVPGYGASFAGPVLAGDQEVTGEPLVDISVSTTGRDANLFAYLEDVAPDGTITVVTEGRLRASLRTEGRAPWIMPAGVPWHRAFAEDVRPLTPGEPVRLRFAMMPTSWLFRAGHRIQVTVTGSDHRERGRDPEAARQTISVHASREWPSSVTLPAVPAEGRTR